MHARSCRVVAGVLLAPAACHFMTNAATCEHAVSDDTLCQHGSAKDFLHVVCSTCKGFVHPCNRLRIMHWTPAAYLQTMVVTRLPPSPSPLIQPLTLHIQHGTLGLVLAWACLKLSPFSQNHTGNVVLTTVSHPLLLLLLLLSAMQQAALILRLKQAALHANQMGRCRSLFVRLHSLVACCLRLQAVLSMHKHLQRPVRQPATSAALLSAVAASPISAQNSQRCSVVVPAGLTTKVDLEWETA